MQEDSASIKKPHSSFDIEDKDSTSILDLKTIKSDTVVPLNDKRYWGYDRSVWIGLYVGVIVFAFGNNIMTFLLFGFYTYPVIGLVAWLIDLLILLPLFLLARKGLAATQPDVEELPGSWQTSRLVLLSFLFFNGLLWGLDSLFKQAALISPNCVNSLGVTEQVYKQQCSWAAHKTRFYLHAITGPLVLICAVFNFMKFSRGIVFSIDVHRWVGRIHNILMLIATIGAAMLAQISATLGWIKIGFYILICFWSPTMLMGWYHIR
jgi:hypothetical protein